ncbi:MAG: serine/threonine protein kinase [Deltaproteobacteria bacterium]|nr:serine/threonine protein kinase [Deltaproteobacteria bacterium]
MTKPRPFGHYFILEKIAQGGMAEIFKGLTYDFSGIKKFIVIKRILPHIAANPEFIDMLIAEAKIAVSLSHGNIAQIYDLGKVGNDYFIVMEYVDGKSLSHIQKKCSEKSIPIPVEYCAFFISELCNGLDYIHRRKDERGNDLKIVHRDISPQNIIASYSGNLKIVDFGVAKAAFKLGESEKGVLKGKFAYMSPEQAEGLEIDHRSDIFSAGIVLWEMLTSQRLFKKKSNLDTVEAVKNMVVVPPSQFRPDIHYELDLILSKALEKDPDKRYATAHDMSLDLTKYLLKYYPDFKSSNVNEFISHLFDQDEDVTGDIHFEKTMKEDATLLEKTGTLTQPLTSNPFKKVEITQVVQQEEIDFKSVFDEMSWTDESVSKVMPLSSEAFQEKAAEFVPSNYDELSETGFIHSASKSKKGSQNLSSLKPVIILLGFILLMILFVWMIRK